MPSKIATTWPTAASPSSPPPGPRPLLLSRHHLAHGRLSFVAFTWPTAASLLSPLLGPRPPFLCRHHLTWPTAASPLSTPPHLAHGRLPFVDTTWPTAAFPLLVVRRKRSSWLYFSGTEFERPLLSLLSAAFSLWALDSRAVYVRSLGFWSLGFGFRMGISQPGVLECRTRPTKRWRSWGLESGKGSTVWVIFWVWSCGLSSEVWTLFQPRAGRLVLGIWISRCGCRGHLLLLCCGHQTV